MKISRMLQRELRTRFIYKGYLKCMALSQPNTSGTKIYVQLIEKDLN